MKLVSAREIGDGTLGGVADAAFVANELGKAERALAGGDTRAALRRLSDAAWNLATVSQGEQAAALLTELHSRTTGRQQRRAAELLQVVEATIRTFEMGDRLVVGRLEWRLSTLLGLLLADLTSDESDNLVALFVQIAAFDRRGDVDLDRGVRARFPQWGQHLRDAYVRGFRAFEAVNTAALGEHRLRMEKSLKAIAVDLLTRGATVRGLGEDAIPLVAYALVHNQLPIGVGTALDANESEERLNDALLSKADFASRMPSDDRAIFFSLFRLAFLLGIAQSYGRALALQKISVT